MAVKIISRTYNEIYTPGETDWLLGNVGEWQSLKLNLEVAIDYFATTQEPVQIDRQNNAFILSNGKNWGEYGFDPGMQMVAKWKKETTDANGNTNIVNNSATMPILNVAGNRMEVLNQLSGYFQPFDSIPANFGNERIFEIKFYVDRAPEGCRIKYSHLTNENYDTQNLNSFIDGTITELAKPNVNEFSGVAMPMEPVGFQSGMSIRLATIKKIGKKIGTDNVYRFEIIIQYMISSLFEDLSTFENMVMPSYLEGEGSLTDNFVVEFYPEWNNPNTLIKNEIDRTKRLGNTGWFNENYNQLRNDFKVESLEYFDENGNQVDSLDFSSPTKVKAVISGVPHLNQNTECGFGFAWIPANEQDYKNKLTPFYMNVFTSTGDISDGFRLNTNYPDTYYGAGINGAAMNTSGVKFTSLNTQIIFEATFTPNAEFFSLFNSKAEDDRNYVLWLSVADSALTRNFSDRVSLVADFSMMTKNIPPAGEYPYIDNRFIEHPFGNDALGEVELIGYVQDDFLCRMPFRIPNDRSTKFQNIAFGVETVNIGEGKTFELERFDVDLTPYPTDTSGVQQFNFNATRGFKLNQGNNKNIVRVVREPSLDTNDFNGYLAYFATKIRWEDWIARADVPSDFFSETELNTGFHNDWVHFQDVVGWRINFFAEITASVNDELKLYRNKWAFEFSDYDANPNVDTKHEYFKQSDNSLLNVGTDPEYLKPLGVVLSNELTRIEISYDILDDAVWDLSKTYAVITIEIDKGAGRFEMRQLSSVWASESDNPLIPVEGETKLKMELDATLKELKTTCLIDPELLPPGAKYRITGRVGCLEEGEIFDAGLYEFRYEETYE